MPLETDKLGGFKFSLAEQMSTGLYPDVFSSLIPLWETGRNIQFTDLGVEKIAGWSTLVDTTNGQPIRGLLQTVENVTDANVYFGDLSQLYLYEITDAVLTVLGTGYNLAEDSGSSVWDLGASIWDEGASLWDAGVISADHWSLVNYGTFILATSGEDAPQIRKDSGKFVPMVAGGVSGFFLTDGGTGYTAGDLLTLTGDTGGTGATAEVLTVSTGVITETGLQTGGSGYIKGETVTVSGGTGSGATGTISVSDLDVDTIEIFINRGPHVLGFKTSVSEKEFIWCAADDPDTWVTSTTNLAGQLEIRELLSEIVAVVPIGNRIAVYGKDQLFLVNYLANDLVFGYQPAINGIGAVSSKAVVPVGRFNYGLSEQGFFETDGVNFEYIDEPSFRNYYQNNANFGQIEKAIGFHDEANNQVRWYFPTGTGANVEGVSFNYRKRTWSIIEGDRSAGDERRILISPISGSETGILYREGVGTNADQEAMTAFVRTKPLAVGNVDAVKELDSIRIGYVGMDLTYRIGFSETADGPVTYGPYVPVADGYDFHNLRTAGRWLFLELYSDTLNASWEVMNTEIIGRVEGTR